MKRDYAAFAIPLIEDSKEFVLIQDAFMRNNKWKFPGGKKHKTDDSVTDTLMRELKQEVPQIIVLTNLFVDDRFYIKYHFDNDGSNPHDLYFCYTEVEFRGPFKPQGSEIKAIESFTLGEVKDLIKNGHMIKNHANGFKDLVLSKL